MSRSLNIAEAMQGNNLFPQLHLSEFRLAITI